MRKTFLICLAVILVGCRPGSEEPTRGTVRATSGSVPSMTPEQLHRQRFEALAKAKVENEVAFKTVTEEHSFTQVIPGKVLGDMEGRQMALEHIDALRKGKNIYFTREEEIDNQIRDFSEHKFGKNSKSEISVEGRELSKLWDKVLDSAKNLVDFAQKHSASYDAENNSIVLDGDAYVEQYNRLLDTYYLAAVKLEKRTKEISADRRRKMK